MLFLVRTVLTGVVLCVLLHAHVLCAGEVNLAAVVKDAEKAAVTQKKTIDALLARSQQVMETEHGGGSGACAVGGCSSFRAKGAPLHIESPLLASNRPLIFVSASMPIASLKRLAYQATQHNAILVIRGMVKDSMVATAQLVDEIAYPLEIDPKLFERFGVKQVPLFLVKHNETWHTVSGNVDLTFALETVTKKANQATNIERKNKHEHNKPD